MLGSKIDGLPIDLRTDVNEHLQYDELQKLCIQNCGNTEKEAQRHGERSNYPNSLGTGDGWSGNVHGLCKEGSSFGLLSIL